MKHNYEKKTCRSQKVTSMTHAWTHVVQEKQASCQPMYANMLQVNIQGMVKLGNWSEGSVIHSGE